MRTLALRGRPGPAPVPAGHAHRLCRLLGAGLLATLAAMAATTLGAALASDAGVDLEVSGGEAIPLSGFAVVTGFFSLVGVAVAVALRRWSARPAERFVRTAVALTALSLVPPFLAGADAATTAVLLGLHLVAAAVVIPALARSLRAGTGQSSRATSGSRDRAESPTTSAVRSGRTTTRATTSSHGTSR